mgnify:FL=1
MIPIDRQKPALTAARLETERLHELQFEGAVEMARVVVASHLRRHVDCPPTEAAGETLREVLETVFLEYPRLRGYVLEDSGCLRQHVTVYIDSRRVVDTAGLSDPVGAGSEVYVLQALSGG